MSGNNDYTRPHTGAIDRQLCRASLLALLCALLSTTASADVAAAKRASTKWYDTPAPNQVDWSPSRKAGYAKSLKLDVGRPTAVLRIPGLAIDVAVFADAGKLSLERGAGWVESTKAPGQTGNIAIAGHRDGFFRPLENMVLGMPIVLATATGQQTFEVTEITVVDALDVSVLDDTEHTVLTLITCHPFRYQGFAPDRYIVRARARQTYEGMSRTPTMSRHDEIPGFRLAPTSTSLRAPAEFSERKPTPVIQPYMTTDTTTDATTAMTAVASKQTAGRPR